MTSRFDHPTLGDPPLLMKFSKGITASKWLSSIFNHAFVLWSDWWFTHCSCTRGWIARCWSGANDVGGGGGAGASHGRAQHLQTQDEGCGQVLFLPCSLWCIVAWFLNLPCFFWCWLNSSHDGPKVQYKEGVRRLRGGRDPLPLLDHGGVRTPTPTC